MQFHSHANQSHFHKNGFALRLALKQRHKGTRKWPIDMLFYPIRMQICCLYIVIQKIFQIWFFPRFGGKKWRRSEHAYASYLGLSLCQPDFSPYMGEFRDWTNHKIYHFKTDRQWIFIISSGVKDTMMAKHSVASF